MIELEALWALLLIPIPILVRRFAPVYRHSDDVLRAPFYARLQQLTEDGVHATGLFGRGAWLLRMILTAIWLLLVLALTKPVQVGEVISTPQYSRDFLVALDISQSMSAEDMGESSRLQAAQAFVKELVEQRKGDRMALLAFASQPYVQMPFTSDRPLFIKLLNELRTGMAGPKTMLGDAIGLGLRHFHHQLDHQFDQTIVQRERVMLLMADGNDSGSQVPVLEAARIAAAEGITIHTVLVGSVGSAADDAVDEGVMRQIASLTGGHFFRAGDRQALNTIGETLNAIEVSEPLFSAYRPKRDLYYWPLGLALLLALTAHLAMIVITGRHGATGFADNRV